MIRTPIPGHLDKAILAVASCATRAAFYTVSRFGPFVSESTQDLETAHADRP
ncbi:hypothetical protein OAN80_02915 [Alphaproteobacteria bacterium]|nr:hypothetical protein [Alphaproteobacteria bacterium]